MTLAIDSQFDQFAESSSLQVLTAGLIGEQYLGLVPGFVFDDEEMLADGDQVQDTKSALVLEDLIGQFIYRVGGDDS